MIMDFLNTDPRVIVLFFLVLFIGFLVYNRVFDVVRGILFIFVALLLFIMVYGNHYLEIKNDEYLEVYRIQKEFQDNKNIQNKIKEILEDKKITWDEYEGLKEVVAEHIKKGEK